MKAIVIQAPRDIRLDDWLTEELGPGQVAVRIAAGLITGDITETSERTRGTRLASVSSVGKTR